MREAIRCVVPELTGFGKRSRKLKAEAARPSPNDPLGVTDVDIRASMALAQKRLGGAGCAPKNVLGTHPGLQRAVYPAPTVDAFFVDQLKVYGFEAEPAINGSFAGCAQLPGHIFVETSDFAELSPATLMGHELGHNLNLQHLLANPDNLMNFLFPHGKELTDEQVATILASPLVQTDPSDQKFIDITPIAM